MIKKIKPMLKRQWIKERAALDENGNPLSPENSDAVQWCLLGWFDKLRAETIRSFRGNYDLPEYHKAMANLSNFQDKMRDYLKANYMDRIGVGVTLSCFNDHCKTTYDEVKRAFEVINND